MLRSGSQLTKYVILTTARLTVLLKAEWINAILISAQLRHLKQERVSQT